MRVRTGDRAILVGVAAIVAYERCVRDDADLISSRVAAYKARRPVLTTAVVLVTAGHLLEYLPAGVDPYHRLVKWFRSPPTPPQPRHQPHHG